MAALLHRFERVQMIYKTINDVHFDAAVLVPRSIPLDKETKSPVLVHFHGGGLMMGTLLEPVFLSLWPVELAEAEGAIIVSPLYRLIPEATGPEILDDIKDFWGWVHNSLPSLVRSKWPHLTLDLDRVAACGESAGGYLTLQSAFLVPEAKIKVCMPQYGAMHTDIPSTDEVRFADLTDEERAAAKAKTEDYIASIRPGAIRISSPYPEFRAIGMEMFKARGRGILGSDPCMTLEYSLKAAKHVPPVWYAQGTEDKIIPLKASNDLIERLRAAHPDTPVLYSTQPGGHGFDNDFGLREPWVAEGVEFVRKYW